MAVIQGVGIGLQGFDLVAQDTPAFEGRILLRADQPLVGGGQQRREALEQFRRAVFQRVHGVVQCVDHRQQVDHPPAQLLCIAHRLRPGALVGQLADHQFQGVEGSDHAAAQGADFLGLHVAAEEALAVDLGVGKPLAHRVIEHRRQASRPEHRPHHRRHGDAKEDLFGPRFGHIPHRQRVIHHRQGDQRQGVAGQHQRIAVGGAQVQGQEQQNPGPQRDHHHQHVRRLHKHRHKKHRSGRAHEGTDRPVQRLGAGRADKRAGHDIHRGHRPIRTRHLHQHGDVQRDH